LRLKHVAGCWDAIDGIGRHMAGFLRWEWVDRTRKLPAGPAGKGARRGAARACLAARTTPHRARLRRLDASGNVPRCAVRRAPRLETVAQLDTDLVALVGELGYVGVVLRVTVENRSAHAAEHLRAEAGREGVNAVVALDRVEL